MVAKNLQRLKTRYTTKNPLRKRIWRELKDDFGRYCMIFLLMLASIGFVSGFLVADGSMLSAYNDSFERYNIEDGYFEVDRRISQTQNETIETEGILLYENFYVDMVLTNGSTMRIFKNREAVDRVCLMSGNLPRMVNEIAIDRMYADNNGIAVGDVIRDEDHTWTITGLVALSDYSALFSDNNDSMFDASKFGVAVVTSDAFKTFDTSRIVYRYAWTYDEPLTDEASEKVRSDDLMTAINNTVNLRVFIPQYLNQAIHFTGNDMGSDKAMMMTLLYVIIVIMAFVFAMTMIGTINREAAVIGTLRASGYTERELIRHYMTPPLIVTLFGALIGNILGYTVLKDFCAGMYYGSYSLPTYETVWSAEAFLMTTVVPLLIMLLINYCLLKHKLSLSPLKFLRRDLSRKKQKRALPLGERIPFMKRFRIRVFLQNTSNYLMLFIGILFANLLLMFGLMLPSVLSHYQTTLADNLLCKYQYILQVPVGAVDSDRPLSALVYMMYFQHEVETENEDAEKFSAYSLKTLGDDTYKSESVMLYGLNDESKYIPIDWSGQVGTDHKRKGADAAGGIFVSSAYASKYGLKVGDEITLKEAYEDKQYTLTISGIYPYEGALTVFMQQDRLNELFDLGDDYFSGYLSDTEITDIDEKYVGSVIDFESLTKISRQLDISMGSMMNMVNIFAIGIYVILIYLLSRMIIEKNAQSISMVKILGYTNKEVSSLYMKPTSIMVLLFLLISLPIENELMFYLFKYALLTSISGWIAYYVAPIIYVKIFVAGAVTYAAVALLEYRKIKKIPMDTALKNVE